MTFPLTANADRARRQPNLRPNFVVSFEGYPRRFGAVEISRFLRIGDPGLLIGSYNGEPWHIGALALLDNQGAYVSFDGGSGTSKQITQTLAPDRGEGTSVQTLGVELVDKNEEITQLISPGQVLSEIMGRSAKVEMGFADTSYPEDYITVFRGRVADLAATPGSVIFGLASPEQQKRVQIYSRVTAVLNQTIASSGAVTSITLEDASEFTVPQVGPDGTADTDAKFYIRIDDEIFSYTGVSGNQLTGCTRAQLGTAMAAHADEAAVSSAYGITGNVLDAALKIMLSGWNGPWVEDVAVTSVNEISAGLEVANALYFQGVRLNEEYGVTVGDYVTTSDSAAGANNVAAKQILDMVELDSGTYLVIDDVAFVTEATTAARVAFRSQYDTFTVGLRMSPAEVDVLEHQRLRSLFLSAFEVDARIEDSVEGKAFIDRELYMPATCFSIPRKARASVGYHIGPIPGQDNIILDASNVLNPGQLRIHRSTSKNFANMVAYNYDQELVGGRFLTSKEFLDESPTAVPGLGKKGFRIDAKALRSSAGAGLQTQLAAQRLLTRYARGAEFIPGVRVLFGYAYNLEIGDVVLVDTAGLKVADTRTGTRNGTTRFFEIINKRLDTQTGEVSVDLVDTAFLTTDRYGLISPSSYLKVQQSARKVVVKPSFSEVGALDEGAKWRDLIGAKIIVRKADWSVRSAGLTLKTVVFNTLELEEDLAYAPTEGDVLELDVYDDQPDFVKRLFAFMTDDLTFPDDEPQYLML